MIRFRSLFLSSFLLVSCVAQAHAAWIWTPQTRRWINPKYAAKDTPSAQMDWAVGFFEKKDYERASKEFVRLVRSYPRSELAPEAQYLAGVSFELMGRAGAAYDSYKKLVEIYPFSGRFRDAIEREFMIAEELFAGRRLQLFGPIKVPALDKAIEIYQHVVDHAPYGEYGDRSQLRLGESYLRQNRYEEANRAFQRMVDDYPNSPLVEQAKFKVAFCARQLSLRPSYDQSATDEAIDWYEKFIAGHPDSDLVPQARESLKQLHEIKAEGLAKVARFYEIQGKPGAAVVYYREVVEKYPDTIHAAAAISKLKEFEQTGVLKK
ncbi:MAG: outer membrane protein assembly factor BamD [Candidatus Omnitrophica bacterium]|nr:outer membrane protein assembly factor BamD [Candidatus Omnitrophota bacterium]